MQKTITLNHYLHLLNRDDKALICMAMRTFGGFADAHNGLLPFFKMEGVVSALRMTMSSSARKRIFAALLEKLEAHKHQADNVSPMLALDLDDNKVHRRFGKHPERGVSIPGTGIVERTAGLAWNLGKRNYVPAPVQIPGHVGLTRAGKNHWWVFTQRADREKVALFLIDHCGLRKK